MSQMEILKRCSEKDEKGHVFSRSVGIVLATKTRPLEKGVFLCLHFTAAGFTFLHRLVKVDLPPFLHLPEKPYF